MSVRITSNVNKILSETRVNSNLFLRYFVDEVHKKAEPRTPRDKGNLARDVLKQVLGLKGKIVWSKEYAQAQEAGMTRGYPIRNYTTPGTGKKYAVNAIDQTTGEASKIAKKARLI